MKKTEKAIHDPVDHKVEPHNIKARLTNSAEHFVAEDLHFGLFFLYHNTVVWKDYIVTQLIDYELPLLQLSLFYRMQMLFDLSW